MFLKKRAKKLVSVLATSILVIIARKKTGENDKNNENDKYLETNLI